MVILEPAILNSWKFFTNCESGDVFARMVSILGIFVYHPNEILEVLFNRFTGGKQVDYEAFIDSAMSDRESNSVSLERKEDNICCKFTNNNCFAILAAKPYICEDEPQRL